MPELRRFLGPLALSALLFACPPPGPATPVPCGPANCQGCCGADGLCRQGVADEACGLAGLQCADCGSTARCQTGACVSRELDGGGGGSTGSDAGEDGGHDAGITDAGTGCAPGLERCGTACVSLTDNPEHCGQCQRRCNPGDVCAGQSCQPGPQDCRTTPCPGGYYCDLANGRCLSGCAANSQCPQPGTCDLSTHTCRCNPGFNSCGGQCVAESAASCGTSCRVCPSPANGQATCGQGACGVRCNPGFHDCSGTCASNTSVQSCGSSCSACPTDPNGTATCNGSSCGLSCASGYLKCGPGCAACPTAGATATACSGSRCVATACASGHLLCADACAVCPSQGTTTVACAGAQCVATACSSGYRLCGSACAACPTQGVSTSACDGTACVATACSRGYRLCASGCCPWGFSLVDSSAAGPADLALVSNLPWVAYRTGTNDLAVTSAAATADGGFAWTSAVSLPDAGVLGSVRVDKDGAQRLHVAFDRSGSVYYAEPLGAGFRVRLVDSSGAYPTLRLSSQNEARLTFQSGSGNNPVTYARWTGSSFVNQAVDSNAGSYSSLALDGSGFAHLTWYDAVNKDLKYARWNGSGWSMQVVESTGDVGKRSSLVLDRSGTPHVAYVDLTLGQLKYARLTTQGWDISVVGPADGFQPFLALDRNEVPHVLYADDTSWTAVRFARKTSTGFAISTLEDVYNLTQLNALALDDQGRPYALFYARVSPGSSTRLWLAWTAE